LWLLGLAGAFVFIEPSPYEAVALLALCLFAATGLRLTPSILVLAVLLIAFNLGGSLSLLPFLGEQRAVQFVAVSWYLAVTAVFLAMVVRDDTLARLEALKGGYIVAALVASSAGILGYFDVAGLGDLFSFNERASGTFKDPNVLGPFAVLPLVWLAQDMLAGRGAASPRALAFGVILFGGVFLSFSRGAWAHAAGSIGLLVLLTFLTAPSPRLRRRIVLASVAGAALLVAGLIVALSFESIRAMFELRASLVQDYDGGVTGRFGNQLRSISELLERPNGFGPVRFRFHFPEDPHNVFVNAFASYGWLGGVSYLALVAATLVIGWRLVFRRSAWQGHAIAVWATLFVEILQGLQIDTDHWRHWWLMLGLIWGLSSIATGSGDAARSLYRPIEAGR